MPKVVDHDVQRTQLAQRCVELFARRGHSAIAVREIASELGVSTGALYHYFPNKDDLFEAVVRVVVDQDIMEATGTLKRSVPNPRDRLLAVLRYIVAAQPRLVTHYRVLIDFAAQPGADGPQWQSMLKKARRSYAAAMADILEIDDEARVDLVLLVIAGLIKRAMCGDPHTDIYRVAETLDPILFAPED